MLDNAEILIWAVGKIGDGIISVAPRKGLVKMIKTAEAHFKRNAVKWQSHGIGNGLAQVDQDGRKEPGGPTLELNAVHRTRPKRGKTQGAFRGVKGILKVPVAAIGSGNYSFRYFIAHHSLSPLSCHECCAVHKMGGSFLARC